MEKSKAIKLFDKAIDVLAEMEEFDLEDPVSGKKVASITFEELDAMHTTLVAARATLTNFDDLSTEDFVTRLLKTHSTAKLVMGRGVK